MRLSSYLVSLAIVLGGLTAPPAAWAQSPPVPGCGVIFVLNGSGGGYELTNGLLKAMAFSGDKFIVDTVIWSRFKSAPIDHIDAEGHFAGAQQLANRIQHLRMQQPARKIFVAAFSTGNRVALEAMKQLPPNSVERIILLGASVSYCYDLGPALRASRDGIDSFYSYDDGVLEAAVANKGTSDGLRVPAGGRVGFWLPATTVPTFPLYQQKLRQIPWQTGFVWTGHRGNHLGWVEFAFLGNYVLPLLRQSEMQPKVIAPVGA